MENEICFFLFKISKKLSENAIFFIFNGGIVLTAGLCILFLFLKRERAKTIRFIYLVCAVVLTINQATFTILRTENVSLVITFTLCSISVSVALLIPVFLLPYKRKVNKAERELIQTLDQSIELEDLSKRQPFFSEDKVTEVKQVSKPVLESEKKDDIDFSHVKNIIERLDYYNLSSNDKRQVKELKEAVLYAENYGVEKDTKAKINDGLGYLLKIMSKYGI